MKTIRLGDEYDSLLHTVLRTVLINNGAVINEKSWAIGGSQEIGVMKIQLGEECVVVESETYIGLSIAGPEKVVERLANEINAKLNSH